MHRGFPTVSDICVSPGWAVGLVPRAQPVALVGSHGHVLSVCPVGRRGRHVLAGVWRCKRAARPRAGVTVPVCYQDRAEGGEAADPSRGWLRQRDWCCDGPPEMGRQAGEWRTSSQKTRFHGRSHPIKKNKRYRKYTLSEDSSRGRPRWADSARAGGCSRAPLAPRTALAEAQGVGGSSASPARVGPPAQAADVGGQGWALPAGLPPSRPPGIIKQLHGGVLPGVVARSPGWGQEATGPAQPAA